MKKVLFILGLVVSTMSFAQKNTKLTYSLGVQTMASVGTLSQTHNFSVGVVGQTEYRSDKEVSYLLNVEFNNIVAKSGVKSINQIPILVGPKVKVTTDLSAGILGGISLYNQDLGTQFTYSPFVSYGSKNISINVKYLSSLKDNANLSSVGLGVTYKF